MWATERVSSFEKVSTFFEDKWSLWTMTRKRKLCEAISMLLLVLLLGAAADHKSAMGACVCTTRGNNLYGSYCASWDAADEKPWCAVASIAACGEDDTFESEKGMFWSRGPCDGMEPKLPGGDQKKKDARIAAPRAPRQQLDVDAKNIQGDTEAGVRELLRAFARLDDGKQYMDRRPFRKQFPKNLEHCTCCCCAPSITNVKFVERPSAALDKKLKDLGIAGCAGIKEHLKITGTVTYPGEGGKVRLKRDSGQPMKFATFQGREVVVTTCGTRSHMQCGTAGVATLLEFASSPFIIDVVAYCIEPSGKGTLVLEKLPYMAEPKYVVQRQKTDAQKRLAVLGACISILGAAKAYHSVGRLLADYGNFQHLISANQITKLMDVDCTSEVHRMRDDEVMTRKRFMSVFELNANTVEWTLPPQTWENHAEPATWLFSRNRDFMQVATFIVQIVEWRRLGSVLTREDHDKLRPMFIAIAQPDNTMQNLDTMAAAIVDVLAPDLAPLLSE